MYGRLRSVGAGGPRAAGDVRVADPGGARPARSPSTAKGGPSCRVTRLVVLAVSLSGLLLVSPGVSLASSPGSGGPSSLSLGASLASSGLMLASTCEPLSVPSPLAWDYSPEEQHSQEVGFCPPALTDELLARLRTEALVAASLALFAIFGTFVASMTLRR